MEWNMNIWTKHNLFHTAVLLYFHAFQGASVIIQQVFCSSIEQTHLKLYQTFLNKSDDILILGLYMPTFELNVL